MVWAGISLHGATDLYVIIHGGFKAVRYRDEVLHPMVRSYTGTFRPETRCARIVNAMFGLASLLTRP